MGAKIKAGLKSEDFNHEKEQHNIAGNTYFFLIIGVVF